MIKLDEEALICDLAETYHIYDYKQLPLSTVAVFACGLREDSRIRLKMSGQKLSTQHVLLAAIADAVNLIWWSKTRDAEKGKNRPISILGASTQNEKKADDIEVYASGKDFEEAREKLITQAREGGGPWPRN